MSERTEADLAKKIADDLAALSKSLADSVARMGKVIKAIEARDNSADPRTDDTAESAPITDEEWLSKVRTDAQAILETLPRNS